MGKKNPHQINDEDSLINKAATYSPRKTQVPSAMGDLTSLFGMGRGEHPRQNHHKVLQSNERLNNVHIGKLVSYKKKK